MNLVAIKVESKSNQSRVKFGFCSEKVPVFRSRLDCDSNMIRTKVVFWLNFSMK